MRFELEENGFWHVRHGYSRTAAVRAGVVEVEVTAGSSMMPSEAGLMGWAESMVETGEERTSADERESERRPERRRSRLKNEAWDGWESGVESREPLLHDAAQGSGRSSSRTQSESARQLWTVELRGCPGAAGKAAMRRRAVGLVLAGAKRLGVSKLLATAELRCCPYLVGGELSESAGQRWKAELRSCELQLS